MGAVTADVEVSWTLDVPGLQGRLDAAILRVLTKSAKAMVADARKKWRGWVYQGRPLSKRNISINEWASTVQGTQAPYSVTVQNEAHGVYSGKPYVSYVHRSGSAKPEAEVVFESWASSLIPQLEADLIKALHVELGKPGPRKTRRVNKASDTKRLII